MKKILPLFLFIFLLPAFAAAGGNYEFNERCKKAYHEIISLRLNSGKQLLEKEKKANPDNLLPYYLENYVDFLTIIITEEEDLFKSLEDNKAYRKEILSQGNENSPYYRHCLANLELQWAFSRLKFEEYFSAALEINRAYRLLEKNKEEYPGFLPDNIAMGVLHTMIGVIPEKYEWAKGLLGLKGSVKQGEEELGRIVFLPSASPYSHLRSEALFFLSFISLNLDENYDKAQELWHLFSADTLNDIARDNLLLTYARARLAMETGRNDEAIEILTNRPKGEEYIPFYYLDYLAGKTKLYRMDEDAVEYFVKYVLHFKGLNYIKAAYQHIAWYFLVRGNERLYHTYMEKIGENGYAIAGADKRAGLALEKEIVPAIPVLRSRLLFDGGYYDRALQVIKQTTPREKSHYSKRDSIEFIYRKARIYHEKAIYDSALVWYRNALELGKETPYYFAANAALMIGKIYEKKENYPKARFYYQLVLTLEFEEYRQSLQQKAKVCVQRVNDKDI